MSSQSAPDIVIRPLSPGDERAWRRLWAGYLGFYRQLLAPQVTERTWERLIDPATPDMIGRVAETGGRVVGFMHAVLHPNTWASEPMCYLEDLYVDAEARRRGVGTALIEALADEGRKARWRRIYWRTATDNVTAQSVYDRLAQRSGWVTYELSLTEPAAGRGGTIATRPTALNPETVAAPETRASHAMTHMLTPGMRRLVISGQVGLRPDRSLPDDLAGQVEQAWTNLLAVLAAAGMQARDLIKVTTFVIDPSPDAVRVCGEIKARRLGDHAPASTYLVVAGLANPGYRVEIEAEALAPR